MAVGLAALAASLAPPFAFGGIAVQRAGQVAEIHMAAAPGIVADAQSLFRAASISKIVTGQVLAKVAAGKVGLNPPYFSADISDILGLRLRHPAYPDTPLTLGLIASHSASLSDAGGYQLPSGMGLQDWLGSRSDLFTPHRPGTAFDYCNLGYILLAAAAEVLSGQRFDHLARDLLSPLGITGGFNWSGVSAADRRHSLPTYRREGAAFLPQIDSSVPPDGLVSGTGTTTIPTDYRLGTDTAIFAPQGGLRLSLAGMLALGMALGHMDQTRLWTPDMGRMDPCGGLFDGYGRGLQILRAPPFYPRPLIGHFANAYGFTGGVWWDIERQTGFAYALNGLPLGDKDDGLSREELMIFDGVASHLAH